MANTCVYIQKSLYSSEPGVRESSEEGALFITHAAYRRGRCHLLSGAHGFVVVWLVVSGGLLLGL